MAGMAITLASTLAIGPATPANAAAAETATFTIEQANNADARYLVYRLFDADIAPNEGTADIPADRPARDWPGIATDTSWTDASVRQAVLAFLDTADYGTWLADAYGVRAGSQEFAFQHDLPQNAAAFIAQRIGASQDDAGAATVPKTKAAKTFALDLARALASSSVAPGTTSKDAEGRVSYTGREGYCLFVTDPATIGNGEAGTSPIWVPLGGKTASIREKTATPTLDKQVREDSTLSWGRIADASKGQDLAYRLTAKMPDNIATFDSYFLKFTDTLPAGMELAKGGTGSVKVNAIIPNGEKEETTDITANRHVSIGKKDNTLVVAIDDAKALDLAIGKDALIVVEYQAHLNDASEIGARGNQNSAKLTYAADPATCVKGSGTWDGKDPAGCAETLEGAHKTRTCTWLLDLDKVDKQTHVPLAGARFTIQAVKAQSIDGITGATDAQSIGSYVQADGSLGPKAHEFETDAQGKIRVPRIDSGTYRIAETAAPTGYDVQDADIMLAIATDFDDEAGTVRGWHAAVSGGEGGKASDADIVTHLEGADSAGMAQALESGTISIQTSDSKKVIMPITGLDGITTVVALGGAAVVAGMAGILATRKPKQPREDSRQTAAH